MYVMSCALRNQMKECFSCDAMFETTACRICDFLCVFRKDVILRCLVVHGGPKLKACAVHES